MKNKKMMPAILSLALISGSTSFAKEATLNAAAVKSVVKSNMQAVQRCYTDLLIEGMATTGKIVVTWNIDAEGKAQDIETKNLKPEDQALSGCVTEKVSSWSFPAANGEKPFPVSYTFNFGS